MYEVCTVYNVYILYVYFLSIILIKWKREKSSAGRNLDPNVFKNLRGKHLNRNHSFTHNFRYIPQVPDKQSNNPDFSSDLEVIQNFP